MKLVVSDVEALPDIEALPKEALPNKAWYRGAWADFDMR